jgi:hypothetical protein
MYSDINLGAGNTADDSKRCAACVPCPQNMRLVVNDCRSGLPNRNCDVQLGVLFAAIAKGFDNATYVRRVFTMAVTEYYPQKWFSDSTGASILNFKDHFRNKLILSHRIPEIRSIIFEPSLSHSQLAFWTSYASAQDAKLAEQTFDIDVFNSFQDAVFTGTPNTNFTFAWKLSTVTSTPQPVLTTNATTSATATTPVPIDPEVPSVAGTTSPHISVYGVMLVALWSTLVHYP